MSNLPTNQLAVEVMAVGWGEKRLLSQKPQAYSKLNNVTRIVMAWGCVQPLESLGPIQTLGQGARPA